MNAEDGHHVLVHERGGGILKHTTRIANDIAQPEIKQLLDKSLLIREYNATRMNYYVLITPKHDGYYLEYRMLGLPFLIPMSEVLGIEVDGRMLYGEPVPVEVNEGIRENYSEYLTACYVECLESVIMVDQIADDVLDLMKATAKQFAEIPSMLVAASQVSPSGESSDKLSDSTPSRSSNRLPSIRGQLFRKGSSKPVGANIKLELAIGRGPTAPLGTIPAFTNPLGEFHFDTSQYSAGHFTFDIFVENKLTWSGVVKNDTFLKLETKD